jgi:hypothetical protein
MAQKELPVCPDLGQLRRQAKEFLREHRRGDPPAAALLQRHHPERLEPTQATLAGAATARRAGHGWGEGKSWAKAAPPDHPREQKSPVSGLFE